MTKNRSEHSAVYNNQNNVLGLLARLMPHLFALNKYKYVLVNQIL